MTNNYEKDGDKVSIYCKPYLKAKVDVISLLTNQSIQETVEMLINKGIEQFIEENKRG